MDMKRFNSGILDSNSYVVWSGSEGVVIDAGVSDKTIVDFVKEKNINIKYIILTHGHIDHIYFVDKLKTALNAEIVIHKNDNEMLTKGELNASRTLFARDISFSQADVTVEDGDILTVGELKFEMLHTPGHSMGSMCIKLGNSLFSGDTMFCCGFGRTDLYGGSHKDMLNSLKEKLIKLDDSTRVFPGHGNSTTIGFEKQFNY